MTRLTEGAGEVGDLGGFGREGWLTARSKGTGRVGEDGEGSSSLRGRVRTREDSQSKVEEEVDCHV